MDVTPNIFCEDYEVCRAELCGRDELILASELQIILKEVFRRNEYEQK